MISERPKPSSLPTLVDVGRRADSAEDRPALKAACQRVVDEEFGPVAEGLEWLKKSRVINWTKPKLNGEVHRIRRQ